MRVSYGRARVWQAEADPAVPDHPRVARGGTNSTGWAFFSTYSRSKYQEEEVKEQDRRAVEVDRERRARRPPDDDRWPLCLFLPGRGACRQRLSGPAPPAAAFACRLTSRTRFWRSTGRLLLRLSPQCEKHCVFVESQRLAYL